VEESLVLVAVMLCILAAAGISKRILGTILTLPMVYVALGFLLSERVLGTAGALLAVPLTMAVIKLVLESSDETRWLVDLMGGAREASDSPWPLPSTEGGT
jgi:predicted PurR-regulated permease PerM